MTVVWAHSKSNNVFDAVSAVEQALNPSDEQAPVETQPEDLFMGDRYLAENVGVMRAGWEINPWAVVALGGARLGRALDIAQRGVRRLTWWYTRPQLDQASAFNAATVRAIEASAFNAATVRAIEALLARILRMDQRIHALESTHSEARLRTFDEQLRAMREEQSNLLRRIAHLESELGLKDKD